MGGPKALMEAIVGEPWVIAASRALQIGGCEQVYVASGAAHDRVAQVLEPTDVSAIHVPQWSEGLGTTLRTSLAAIDDSDVRAEAVMLHLVDLPDVGPDVVRRLHALAGRDVLARATYSGRPGHPVLVGRSHWAGLMAGLNNDEGGSSYLARHDVVRVECEDLACGLDADSLEDVAHLRSAMRTAGFSTRP